MNYVMWALGLIGGAAVASVFYAVVVIPGERREAVQQYVAEQAAKDLVAEAERKKNDAKLQNMSDYDLCVYRHGRVPDCNVFLRTVRSK